MYMSCLTWDCNHCTNISSLMFIYQWCVKPTSFPSHEWGEGNHYMKWTNDYIKRHEEEGIESGECEWDIIGEKGEFGGKPKESRHRPPQHTSAIPAFELGTLVDTNCFIELYNYHTGDEGSLEFPDLWSVKKLWLNWYLTPVVNFGEVRRAQLAKSTLFTFTLVPLGSFQIF